jgi:hypothetical protein
MGCCMSLTIPTSIIIIIIRCLLPLDLRMVGYPCGLEAIRLLFIKLFIIGGVTCILTFFFVL